uniref:Peptidase C39 domain-containing protein n=1 Tax=Salmonella phage vB_SEnST11_KE23 TaxID=3161174 RepID=A0AAU8GEL9_9CAUD
MIKHLTQPTKDSCMATCLAMVIGISAEEALKMYHTDLQLYKIWFDDVLEKLHIPYYYGSPRSSRISGNVLCFATVASLNMPGMLHQILIQSVDGELTVYDPAKGRSGSKYYIPHTEGPETELAKHLQSWTLDLILPLVHK